MTPAQARTIFAARYFEWTKLKADIEIASSLPSLRSFKAGVTWKLSQFMKGLNPASQKIYASALLKRHYAAASKDYMEALSPQEETLLAQGSSFSPYRKEDSGIEPAKHKGGFATKAGLRSAVYDKFLAAFGNRCSVSETFGSKLDLGFGLNIDNWAVHTSFWFGRQQTVLRYQHVIASRSRVPSKEFPSVTGPAFTLAVFCWIGLFPIMWERVLKEDVDDTTDTVIEQCELVFGQLPVMLRGLSFS